MTNADDNALKVSFFVTDSDGGLEAGDNAVMVSGFADAPMMTNQQPLSFGTAGILQFDPLNFELPNLAYGAYPSSVVARRMLRLLLSLTARCLMASVKRRMLRH